MAPVPMRSNPQDTGHRARVAEPISSRATARPSSSSSTSSTSLSATATTLATLSSTCSLSDNIINNNSNGNSNSSNSSSSSSSNSSSSCSSSSNNAPNQQQQQQQQQQPTPTSTSANFEYDDNEWDIGIGNLIIDLDADIEKTNEGVVGASSTAATVSITASSGSAANNVMSANNATGSAGSKATAAAVAAAAAAKMAVEHSATVDKGLKMKIKRTKPGTKTSEAKHEIVKSNEQNGNAEVNELKSSASKQQQQQHPSSQGPGSVVANSVGGTPNNILTNSNSASSGGTNGSGGNTGSGKRGSSSHRRDKARDKHGSSGGGSSAASVSAVTDKQQQSPAATLAAAATGKTLPLNSGGGSSIVTEVNGLVRVNAASGASQIGLQRSVFPASTGPGPPTSGHNAVTNALPPSPVASPAQNNNNNHSQQQCGPVKLESKPLLNAVTALQTQQLQQQQCQGSSGDDSSASSPPPAKKNKSEPKEVTDVCIGTSVGTITEPDCLGPCEPGTSVTLEGIVWHETEGGVLVVNVTWRGKTYVGTLLDCTRHDWAPPRFCDSPTSDLDARLPKGRETRSSVHSKLRNGGGGVKGRRGTTNGPPTGPSTAPSSPTPFVPPRPEPNNKRKNKSGEDDNSTANANNVAKKSRVAAPPSAPSSSCGSPPPSPVLLECPEPNCSKKYKHINGLKYHQSHAHGGGGSADDEDTKDVTSMSENDESNIEAPSPATPVKSPEKPQDNPPTPQKKESTTDQLPLMLRSGGGLLEVNSQPDTPRSTPPSPATPQSIQDLAGTNAGSPTIPIAEPKNVVKPSVLRYNSPEEFPVGVFAGNKSIATGSPISNPAAMPLSRSMNGSDSSNDQTLPPPEQPPPPPPPPQPQSFASQLQTMVPQPFDDSPPLIIPTQNTQNIAPLQPTEQPPSFVHQPPSPQSGKLTQFKVKPASALMPEEKIKDRNIKPPNYKKKSRKSPAGSPHPPQPNQDQPMFGMESSGRDEVQSPAYSDISDDGAPVIEPDVTDKNKSIDKKTETSQAMPHMPQYGMYPFYGQPQYIMPSVQEPKVKEPEKTVDKVMEKEPKKDGPDYQQKVIQQHYYPSYGYVPGYSYNMDPSSYGSVSIVPDDKNKEERLKEEVSSSDHMPKQPTPIHNPIQVPTPGKIKTDLSLKEKHQNENHQILKESIEMKNQMNPYMYQRQQQQQQQQQQQHQQQQHQQHQQQQQQQQQQAQQQQQQHHGQREEDMRRFYVYSDQRRKEQQQQQQHSIQNDHKSSVSNKPIPQSPSIKSSKEKIEEKKEKEIKQEGVKPTMETQGPPPPPTSQYAYIHPSYMQSPHYGALPFDPNHPMYRSIMVPGPYSGNPYLHPQIPRYHAPEDLSRAPPPTKALDMLQHHAQYYSSHKIHELQERAIKSPNPKTSIASSSPSNPTGPPGSGQPQTQVSGPTTSQPSNTAPQGGKQITADNKDSRSPPPQRHVHTHHHTHVGLGYPMYPAPYGAAVLASQQAAAVTVINPYPPK